MKIYPLISAQVFRLTGLTQVILLFLIWPLANTCFGASQTNAIPWNDTFENYTNTTPLIEGTNGWYASSADCIVTQDVGGLGGSAMLPTDITLSNRFQDRSARNVNLEMYVRPQLYDGTNYPDILGTNNDSIVSTNVAVQFFINSNGFFVVGNGTNWNEVTTIMAEGTAARSITNIIGTTNFVKLQVHLRYKTHSWDIKAWTNNSLVANTNYSMFTSNLNYFSGFDIYNGNSTSYVDNVSVKRWPSVKVNGVSIDNIRRINNATPGGKINGVEE